VAPFNLRDRLYELIDSEIRAAEAGRPAGIVVKMNSLEDEEIIGRLYEASRAGVPVELVVRGICCLVAGRAGLSETVTLHSILDRYLEHSRIYVFLNGGDEKLFISSADWMTRNLSYRLEVAVPLYDVEVRRQVRRMLDFQLADNTKAKVVGPPSLPSNSSGSRPRVRAQQASRQFVKRLSENGR
jgi:polyphosphate kinase